MPPEYVEELMRLIRGQLPRDEWGDPVSFMKDEAEEKEKAGLPRFRLRH